MYDIPGSFDPEAYVKEQAREKELEIRRVGRVDQEPSVPSRWLNRGGGLGGRNPRDGRGFADPFGGEMPNPTLITSGYPRRPGQLPSLEISRLHHHCEDVFPALSQTVNALEEHERVCRQFGQAAMKSSQAPGNKETVIRAPHAAEERMIKAKFGQEVIPSAVALPLMPCSKREDSGRRMKFVLSHLGTQEEGPAVGLVLPCGDSRLADWVAGRMKLTAQELLKLRTISGDEPATLARQFNLVADSIRETIDLLRKSKAVISYAERTILAGALGTAYAAGLAIIGSETHLLNRELLTCSDWAVEKALTAGKVKPTELLPRSLDGQQQVFLQIPRVLPAPVDPNLFQIAREMAPTVTNLTRLTEAAMRAGYATTEEVVERQPRYSNAETRQRIWRALIQAGNRTPTMAALLENAGIEATPGSLKEAENALLLATDRRILRGKADFGERAMAQLVARSPESLREPSRGDHYPKDYYQRRLYQARTISGTIRSMFGDNQQRPALTSGRQ